MWQDLIIALCNILFSYSLGYQVIYGYLKKKANLTIQTSLLTTIGLYIMSICFFTLNLKFSGIISFLNGTLWLILLIQSIKYKK
jgi:hypothetical protein